VRSGLDIFPSPVAERPWLGFPRPFQIQPTRFLLFPPLLAAGLALFDGEQTTLDLQAHLSQIAGQIVPRETLEIMLETLQSNGFSAD
jgi:hypothetical protein